MLGNPAVQAIVIIAISGILFMCKAIPMAISALIGVLLMMLARILTPQQVCGSFGSYICVLLACSSIVGEAAFEVGLADYIGDRICSLKYFAKSEKRMLLCIVTVTVVMSMFVANIPVVALFIPIAAAAASRSAGKISAKMLTMVIGFASTIGGCGTLIGASTNMTGNASLQATTGDTLGMFTMMPITLVLCAVMLLYFGTVGYRIEQKVLSCAGTETGHEETRERTELKTSKAVIVALVFLAMMAGFLTGIWNFGIVSMIAVIILILTGCVKFDLALKKADWSTVIVVGASLALASGMNTSGAGELLANSILNLFEGSGMSPRVLLGFTLVFSSLLSCVMQNNAVVTILIPIFCTVAAVLNVNAVTFAVAIICGCNICYATPISTSPISMTLTAGYQFSDYIKIGGPLLIISDIASVLLIPLFYPL